MLNEGAPRPVTPSTSVKFLFFFHRVISNWHFSRLAERSIPSRCLMVYVCRLFIQSRENIELFANLGLVWEGFWERRSQSWSKLHQSTGAPQNSPIGAIGEHPVWCAAPARAAPWCILFSTLLLQKNLKNDNVLFEAYYYRYALILICLLLKIKIVYTY